LHGSKAFYEPRYGVADASERIHRTIVVEAGLLSRIELTESDFERGVSPLVNGALSLLMVPLILEAFVSSVACGVMSEGSYQGWCSSGCCESVTMVVEESVVEGKAV
jgi:hypothetical protein